MSLAFTWVNLAVAFALELCAFWAWGYVAWTAGSGGMGGGAMAASAVVAAVVLWGLFASPRAPIKRTSAGADRAQQGAFGGVPHLQARRRDNIGAVVSVAVKILVIGGAGFGLAAVGQVGLGAALASAFVLNAMAHRLLPPARLPTEPRMAAEKPPPGAERL